MSHVADVELTITDLDALDKACEDLGLELVRGQTTHKWFGKFLNDWNDTSRAAISKGRNAEDFGKCEHAIKIKNGNANNYEIGLVKNADGTFSAIYDAWAGGGGLHAVAGNDLCKLKDEYGARVTMRTLARKGYNCARRVNEQGKVQVVATARA